MDSDWHKKKILLVGETVLDIIQIVPKYPAEDDDIRSNHGRWQRGGNASNSATILALLDENVEILSTFSTAEMFKFVIHDLSVRGISHKNCVYYDNCEPPLSSIWLSEETGSRTIAHSNPNLPHMDFKNFDKCDLSEYKWAHFEGRTPDEFRKMLEKVRKSSDRIKISVGLEKPRGNDMILVDLADVVFLGKQYAMEFLVTSNKRDAVYGLKEMAKRTNFTVICPWATDGCAALDCENNYIECPSYPPEKVVDTLGAGDTFVGAALFALNRHSSVRRAIEFASRIAGAKVGFYGYDPIKEVYKNFL